MAQPEEIDHTECIHLSELPLLSQVACTQAKERKQADTEDGLEGSLEGSRGRGELASFYLPFAADGQCREHWSAV